MCWILWVTNKVNFLSRYCLTCALPGSSLNERHDYKQPWFASSRIVLLSYHPNSKVLSLNAGSTNFRAVSITSICPEWVMSTWAPKVLNAWLKADSLGCILDQVRERSVSLGLQRPSLTRMWSVWRPEFRSRDLSRVSRCWRENGGGLEGKAFLC